MADGYMRKVGLDFTVDGIDQASRKVDDLADATRDVGRAETEVRDESAKTARAVTDDVAKQEKGWRDYADTIGESVDAMSLAGEGVGAAVTKGLDSVSGAQGRIQAQLNLTEEETQRVGEVARNVFTNNFGESLAHAGDTVALVKGSLRDLTDQELQDVSQGVLAIEDAFGHVGADAPIILEDIRAITANFPGTTEAEALDLIVDGFQRGTGNAGDLQDTLQEYPGSFERIGLDADDMFGILNAGMEAGIRNTDFVADAVKEMGIRVVDEGSKAGEALAMIFPPDEAERLRADFAKGGEVGRAAFFDILEGLNAVEDPILRNTAGVELLGTKYEDNANQMPAFIDALGQVESGTGDAAGATEALNAQYENGASTLEMWKRRLTTGTVGALGDFAGGAAEAATSVGTLALGAQGLGIDLSKVRDRVKSATGPMGTMTSKVGLAALKYGALAVAAGLAGKAVADATGASQGDLSTVSEGIETLLAAGESRQLQDSIGGFDGLAVSLGGIADPSMWENIQGGASDALNILGSPFGIDATWAQARQDIEAVDVALADMVSSGNGDQAAEAFDMIAEAAERQGVSVEQILDAMPRYADATDRAAAGQDDAAAAAETLNPLLEKQIDTVGGLADDTDRAARSTGDMARSTDDAEIEFRDLEDAAATLDEAIANLIERHGEMMGAQRGVDQATAGWEESLDGLNESLDTNGTTLDLATEKGRANNDAIWAAQDAAVAHAEAVLHETGSIDAANKALDQQREDLYDVLVQSGLSKDAAREYADQILEIPDDAETRAEFNDARARERISGFVDRIYDIPGNRETYARFFADRSELESWIGRLGDINRTITTRGVFKSSGGPSAYHTGTEWHSGGMAEINERGGELINLPQGTAVTNSSASHDLLVGAIRDAMGGGGGATFNLYGERISRDLEFDAMQLARAYA